MHVRCMFHERSMHDPFPGAERPNVRHKPDRPVVTVLPYMQDGSLQVACFVAKRARGPDTMHFINSELAVSASKACPRFGLLSFTAVDIA
jgi:hypothetical protein